MDNIVVGHHTEEIQLLSKKDPNISWLQPPSVKNRSNWYNKYKIYQTTTHWKQKTQKWLLHKARVSDSCQTLFCSWLGKHNGPRKPSRGQCNKHGRHNNVNSSLLSPFINIPSFSSALLLFLTSLRDIRITSVHQALQGQECLYCLKPWIIIIRIIPAELSNTQIQNYW